MYYLNSEKNFIFKPLNIPDSDLPKYIQGYNMPRTKDMLLQWEFVTKVVSLSEFYWLATTDSTGNPHTVPLWGIWYENRMFFDGNPQTKWIRNLKKNPHVVVHLPSPREVCIIEGQIVILADNDLSKEQWQILDEVHKEKYGKIFGSPYIYVNPSKILAWDTPDFKHMTRWIFD